MQTHDARRTRIMEAEKSGQTLAQKLGASIRDVTVSDAATQTGLALRDAERGLQWAVTTYRGHLKVAEGGDVIYSFPTGFTRPWATKESFQAWVQRLGAAAWKLFKGFMKVALMVVILTYTVVFALIALAIVFAAANAGRDDDDDRGGRRGVSLGDYFAMRLVMDLMTDAIWAAMHMSSVRRAGENEPYKFRNPQKKQKRLYERIYQFIFGPELTPPDPLQEERLLLAMIRERQGRVGLLDVMAVTGLDAPAAEQRLTRLLVDYDGDVEISDHGAVFYVFKDIRKTVDDAAATRVTMAWERPVKVPPLTGDNGNASNVMVVALNSFNLGMSGWVILNNLNLANLLTLLSGSHQPMPDPTAPLLLGWFPFLFSATVFAVPLGRAVKHVGELARAGIENGKRALLKLISREPAAQLPENTLKEAWAQAAGQSPREKALTRQLLLLGGDLHMEDGTHRWGFPDLAREELALQEARKTSSDEEKKLGPVVFNSGD